MDEAPPGAGRRHLRRCHLRRPPDIGGALHAATIVVIGSVPMDRLRHVVPAFTGLSEVWLELILAYQAQGQGGAQASKEGAS